MFRHHGVRKTARKFGTHHKNIERWLAEEMDTIKQPGKRKRKFKKGQGRKLSYPVEIDEQLSA